MHHIGALTLWDLLHKGSTSTGIFVTSHLNARCLTHVASNDLGVLYFTFVTGQILQLTVNGASHGGAVLVEPHAVSVTDETTHPCFLGSRHPSAFHDCCFLELIE